MLCFMIQCYEAILRCIFGFSYKSCNSSGHWAALGCIVSHGLLLLHCIVLHYMCFVVAWVFVVVVLGCVALQELLIVALGCIALHGLLLLLLLLQGLYCFAFAAWFALPVLHCMGCIGCGRALVLLCCMAV